MFCFIENDLNDANEEVLRFRHCTLVTRTFDQRQELIHSLIHRTLKSHLLEPFWAIEPSVTGAMPAYMEA